MIPTKGFQARVARANGIGCGAYCQSSRRMSQSSSAPKFALVCPSQEQGQGVVDVTLPGYLGALPDTRIRKPSGTELSAVPARPHGTKAAVLLRVSPLKGTARSAPAWTVQQAHCRQPAVMPADFDQFPPRSGSWASVPFRGLTLSSTGLLVPCGRADVESTPCVRELPDTCTRNLPLPPSDVRERS